MTAESGTLRRPGRPGLHPHALGRSATPRTTLALLLGLLVLGLLCLASVSIGSRGIGLDTVWAALSGGEVSATDRHAVLGLRLPRTLAAVVVGAALAVAGALMQSLTRNPLAEPGLLGVSAGSAFAVAIAIVGFGITSPLGYIWFALAGAFFATVAVALIGGMSAGKVDPMRMVLAGVALSAVLSGVIGALRLSDPRTFGALQVWEAGILAGRGLDVTLTVAPLVLLALIVALPLGKGLNTLALGDELAAALGVSLWKTRVLSILAITILAGGAAAIAGPIAFIGLMVPHAARFFAGADQRWVLLISLVFGPILMLTADIVARLIVWPGEMPVGLVSALLGAPVLVLLIRRRKALKL
ncbi:FecCD family ABC transporter permease [Nesterenkonia jeotgali]|uniref:FecCD family ABC transporter permease n=1 Tax=Nesterenkonia jeotgali TaxID=317018 RepID=UPI0009FB60A7|nr:iron chelate uptake ABC transporter family permease subunit [Nesterenkonia jeotgali]